jgi:protein-S-isoprenylcysteine O-methyltransferase Ste14
MIPIAVGTAGFLFMLASDWADWRKIPALKTAAVAAAAVCLLYGMAFLFFSPDRFFTAAGLRIAGGAAAAVFFFLLVYSLFLELPFRLTYAAAAGEKTVVSKGTYALTRHPGVLFLFFLHAALIAVSGSRPLLLALPVWTCANCLLAGIEDAVLFPRIFGSAYDGYKKRVPFIVPTAASIQECCATIFPGLKEAFHRRKKHH